MKISWFVKTDLGYVPVDWLKLMCNDCDLKMCSPEHGTCVRDDSKGSTLNKCECHEVINWNESRPVGLNCELVAECHLFAPDVRNGSLTSNHTRGFFLDVCSVPRFRCEFSQGPR
jgi:hypothetical protein